MGRAHVSGGGDDDDGEDDGGGHHGDDNTRHGGDDDSEACGVDALVAGATVLEAELMVLDGEAVWDEVELLKP